MPRPKKLPRYVQPIGDKFRFDRWLKDEAGNRIHVSGPVEHLHPEEAYAAAVDCKRIFDETGEILRSLREIRLYQKTGKTPTAWAAEAPEEPIGIGEVITAHLRELEKTDKRQFKKLLAWSKICGPLIQTAGTKERPTFGRVAVDWVFIQLPHSVSASTADDYRPILKNHILPHFGSWPIQEITRQDVKDFLLGKTAKGLAESTVVHIRNVLSHVFSRAVDAQIIGSNPTARLKGYLANTHDQVEEGPSNTIKPFSHAQLTRLFEAFRSSWPQYYPFIAMQALSGLRSGEAAAIEWEDVDFDAMLLNVVRSRRKGRTTKTKGKRKRQVDMGTGLANILREHMTAQKREALAAGRPVPELVTINLDGKYIDLDHFRGRIWKRAVKDAKIQGHRIYDLRHTYITERLLAGHDLWDVSRQAGHRDTRVTEKVYAHWVPNKRSRL